MDVARDVAREVAVCELVAEVELARPFVHILFNDFPCFGLDGEGYAFLSLFLIASLETDVIHTVSVAEVVLNHIDKIHASEVVR